MVVNLWSVLYGFFRLPDSDLRLPLIKVGRRQLVGVWLSASSCDGRRPIGRRIAGDMSALTSNGNWSVAGSLATWALWRRTATDRRLVGVELLRVERFLLLRPVATSCRSTKGDMGVLASTYVWSRPTWARLRLIATSCSKAAIDLRFGRPEHSCVATCRQLRRNAGDLWLRHQGGSKETLVGRLYYSHNTYIY